MSSLLSKLPGHGVAFCELIARTQALTERYLALQLGPLLAGETLSLLDASSISAGVMRADMTTNGMCTSLTPIEMFSRAMLHFLLLTDSTVPVTALFEVSELQRRYTFTVACDFDQIGKDLSCAIENVL